MDLSKLKYTEGSRQEKHRVGRGHAAGKGKQAGKGQSGQNKRHGHRPGFEGGQTPWFRRIGKRGFNNVNHVTYQTVSLAKLESTFANNEEITIEKLFANNIIKRNLPVKLLATGKVTKTFHVTLHAASAKAIALLEEKKGTFTNL
ncbi:50S ribosomal protein L15 [Mycoplasmopsis opalescens]|uniref:50S ribosomal protein L15 n=1 Tax=Mycoplasmopsis opalescens TaxID=114886 RepID=UPI0004A6E58F|nr:50S ribosomal protein L15 [Mycoplasmopsis opalescens]